MVDVEKLCLTAQFYEQFAKEKPVTTHQISEKIVPAIPVSHIYNSKWNESHSAMNFLMPYAKGNSLTQPGFVPIT